MSEAARVVLSVVSGPNAGDSVRVDFGACRLVGRHLSDSETAFIDRHGNRVLDQAAADILQQHLKDKAPPVTASAPEFRAEAYERGTDIILADDSISRAHAMFFFDGGGLGVIDLASTNGTFVNDDRIGAAFVREGDRIKIGQSELAAEFVDAR